MKEGRKGGFHEGFSKKFSVNKNDRIEKKNTNISYVEEEVQLLFWFLCYEKIPMTWQVVIKWQNSINYNNCSS